MMKKGFRSLWLGLCTAIVLITTFGITAVPAEAAGETMVVKIDKSDAIVNEEVTVSITLTCPQGLYAAQFNLKYDASLFTYVGGDAGGSSFSGVIPLNYMDSGVPTTYTWTLKFKAIKTGTSEFKIEGDTFVDKDVQGFVPSYTNASVRVWAEGSNDATLSKLEVAGYSLNPSFGKWTTDYTVYVETEVTSVEIAATSSQGNNGGRVEISGNSSNLAYGNNYITIKSYAPNGKVITYTINVVRAQPPLELPEWTNVTIDGVEYRVFPEFASGGVPAGFESATYNYKGNEIVAGVNATLGLDILYLIDAEENGTFFLYDKEKDTFYPYMELKVGEHTYVLLPIDRANTVPENSEEGRLMVGEYTIEGYISTLDAEFGYFYAVNETGYYSWYSLDMKEGNIQRCPKAPEKEETSEEEDETHQEESEEMSEEALAEYEELLKEKNSLARMKLIYMITAIVMFVAVLGLVAFIIIDKNGGIRRARDRRERKVRRHRKRRKDKDEFDY